MKKMAMLLSFLAVLLVLFLAPNPGLSQTVPLPPEIEIVAPAPDLPKEIAAFSGKWMGIWNGTFLEGILIIEEINSEEAKVIYAWSDSPQDRVTKGWRRFIAKIIPGSKPKIEFGGANGQPKFTFEMKNDLKSIKGTREYKGYYQTITMKKL